MKFRISMFVDAFLGSGVPLGGDPITSFQHVPMLGLRTATVLNNCYPAVGEVLKLLFIATNCGEAPIEIVPAPREDRKLGWEDSEKASITLLPGESLDYPVFRSWEAPGKHQLTLGYKVRCRGEAFARLAYPTVAIYVRPSQSNMPMHWIWWVRAARLRAW